MGRFTRYVQRSLRPSPKRQRWLFSALAVMGMVGVVARPGLVTVDRELVFVLFAVFAFFPRLVSRLGTWSQSHPVRGHLVNVALFWCLGFGAITYLLPTVPAILIVIALSMAGTSIGYVVQRRRTAG